MGGEEDDRGWAGWMASLTQWTWIGPGSWWWTGKPGVLQSMGSQRVRHDWAAELNWKIWIFAGLDVCLVAEFHGLEFIFSLLLLPLHLWDVYVFSKCLITQHWFLCTFTSPLKWHYFQCTYFLSGNSKTFMYNLIGEDIRYYNTYTVKYLPFLCTNLYSDTEGTV